MFADDGILFSNDIEDIIKFKDNPILKRMGIILSKKIIDGKPSTGLIDNTQIRDIHFVGSVLNVDEGIVRSEKGYCSIHSSTFEISKRIWTGYNEKKEFKS